MYRYMYALELVPIVIIASSAVECFLLIALVDQIVNVTHPPINEVGREGGERGGGGEWGSGKISFDISPKLFHVNSNTKAH